MRLVKECVGDRILEVLDIKSGWMKIVRRLQSIAPTNGISILTIKVVVDAEGNPVFWEEPKRIKLEPKSCMWEEVINKLG
jgi:hypothetical protein